MNKKKKYRKTSEKDIEFNCLNPIFWIIKTKKKNLVRDPSIYLHRYLPTPSRAHSTPTNEQTNENVRQDIEGR